MTIGDKILQLLERRLWGVKDLERLTGISQQQISLWTTNKPNRRPYGNQVKKIADALMTTADYLLDETQTEPPIPLSELERMLVNEARRIGPENALRWQQEYRNHAPRILGSIKRDLFSQPESGDIPLKPDDGKG